MGLFWPILWITFSVIKAQIALVRVLDHRQGVSIGQGLDRSGSVLGALYATCISIQYGTNFDLARIMPTGKISKDRANYFKQGSYQKIVGADFAWSCKDHARRPDGQKARRPDG